MSLHVGHLSPHIRREDLQRVFQRFGRCHIQLKDGYGFVIYDVRANAEKALRILRGKIICGEQISLSWSNRQPRPFQSSALRVYEPDRRRNLKEEKELVGIRATPGQKDFEPGDSQIRTDLAAYVFDGAAGNNGDGIGDLGDGKSVSPKRGAANEVVAVEYDPLVNDRWGEPVGESMVGRNMANEVEFDLYEPYSGFNRGKCQDKVQLDDSFGPSPGEGKIEHSVDKNDKHVVKPKAQLACYNCGLVGHMARNCARGNVRHERFSKFDHRRDDIYAQNRGKRRLKRFRSYSWGRPDAARDPSILRQHGKATVECCQSMVRRMSSRCESSSDSKEKHQHKHRAMSHIDKKRTQTRGITTKVQKKRKSQRSVSSSLSSDSSSASSRSISRSVRSVSDASHGSSSRSRSSGSHSAYTSSRSTLRSSYTRSVSSKSKSRSSFSRLPSLSVSLRERSPISMKNELVDVSLGSSPQNKLKNVSSPYLRDLPFAIVENSDHRGAIPISADKNGLASEQVDSKTKFSHPGCDGDTAQYSENYCDLLEGKSTTEPQKVVADAAGKCFENSREIRGMLRRSSQALNRCLAISSVRITSKEMFLALKHYGLIAHDESELSVSVERYFGAARLWPWEMIYFLRMKKGPISTDNYARRLEQNSEFGIVDKYIRSSSGWGECSQMNENVL